MNIKTFTQLVDEASLRDNPGIPGEGGKEGNYLSKVEGRAKERLDSLQRKHGADISFPRFMSIVSRARQIQAGKEKELEKLAENAIRSYYGSILEEVTLNIKFPKADQIKKSMEKVPSEPPEMPQLKELKDSNIISEIQKRKIANNITQGEAKNTKLCLNLPEVRDGLIRILGQEKGTEYKDLLNKITEIAGFFDWQIPMEVQLEMWKRDKSGFSGSVSVEWVSDKEEDTEELAQKVLGDLENDTEVPEEAEEIFEQTTPTINALGTDFAMLLHETIKGIYELIASVAIPDDEETAVTIIMNTDTLADEIEDLRYGPEIAADLRDFINEFPETADIPNLREHVFGKMMAMDAKDFLELMYMILNEDPKAKPVVQEFVDEISEEINRYELGQAGIDNDDDYEPGEQYGETPVSASAQTQPEEIDYSELSKREIEKLIDKALDAKDYDTVRDLSKYLKESKQQEIFEKLHKEMGYPSNS
jgi:hypothetical protein